MPSMTYIVYLLGVFESSFVSYSVVRLKRRNTTQTFLLRMPQSLFNIPSSYTVYIVKLPETAKQSSSTQIKPQSNRISITKYSQLN